MSIGFYDKKTVAALTTLSSTTLWRLVKNGMFPAPVAISKGRVAWPRDPVDEWLKSKAAIGEAA